ncbi:putative ABC transport system permease protein [Mucilaginibacter gracilis]|uniref:Putative ABC transport system permease protein n=1 Tax=Mucilaginibacter gracilis TaxID=423350 RepID=A0A495J916_9SPHI|nr:ABC transporter permease [Mucilaginibacter gracilis]RKR84549.1 putative ABC transport system permease protein [Mucilaginibacter gracilis]
MLKNYFKIAIAVLRRRKFFTFISLFGISFTLTILMVATAFINNLVSPGYPDTKRDRSLYITLIEFTSNKGWLNRSGSSYYFLTHYAGTLKTAEKIGIASRAHSSNAYVNNKKLVIDIKYTNQAYWDIAEFQFTEGKPYNQAQINQAQRVAVISERTKLDYFGDVPTVVGKYIEADNIQYRVIGVVKSVPVSSEVFYGNMYLPYTVSKSDYRDHGYQGPYSAILLAPTVADVPKMRNEYQQMVPKIPIPDKDFDHIYSNADTYFGGQVRQLAGSGSKSGMGVFIAGAGLLTLLFLLLPTINLVNINITRIMERSSEIGVRKAFGASSKTLVYQFIVENIILTAIGGLIGVILSILVLHFINSLALIKDLTLSLNLTVLFYSLLACLFFGLLSGVYPAWRMSRLNVVTALKAQ